MGYIPYPAFREVRGSRADSLMERTRHKDSAKGTLQWRGRKKKNGIAVDTRTDLAMAGKPCTEYY